MNFNILGWNLPCRAPFCGILLSMCYHKKAGATGQMANSQRTKIGIRDVNAMQSQTTIWDTAIRGFCARLMSGKSRIKNHIVPKIGKLKAISITLRARRSAEFAPLHVALDPELTPVLVAPNVAIFRSRSNSDQRRSFTSLERHPVIANVITICANGLSAFDKATES
jgi:hypothetical protein